MTNCECGQPRNTHYGERGNGGSRTNPECDGYMPETKGFTYNEHQAWLKFCEECDKTDTPHGLFTQFLIIYRMGKFDGYDAGVNEMKDAAIKVVQEAQ